MTGRARHAAAARGTTGWRRPSGRLRVAAALVGGTALVIGSGVLGGLTAAAFTDTARLAVGTDGVGSADRFAIQVVDAGGTAHDAPADAPVPIAVADAALLVPGRTVDIPVRVAANHPVVAAAARATVTASPVAGTADIRPFLRVSVLGPADAVLAQGDLGATEVVADLGTLAPRGDRPVADGAAWSPGAEGSWTDLVVRVSLDDAPGTEPLNGGQVQLGLRVDATSTEHGG